MILVRYSTTIKKKQKKTNKQTNKQTQNKKQKQNKKDPPPPKYSRGKTTMFSILRLLDCRIKSGKVTQPIKVVHYLIYMYMYKNNSV